MLRTPGAEVLPIFSAMKLMRAINEPLLIHPRAGASLRQMAGSRYGRPM